tara:strand:- start:1142 stop:1327 length:186 start_codon:yes stop_codon:yes gene_type:complete
MKEESPYLIHQDYLVKDLLEEYYLLLCKLHQFSYQKHRHPILRVHLLLILLEDYVKGHKNL